ncbi:hypothetical protein M501DRAFT_999833 [Patellaria atrata CBS 101060]|uniref:Uncharacterized protein n=1 Tax=Patellaria atrata CBS 101060 TaxID=1346257 RepID=A0A9P4S1Z6_9PEZI|nr:hypothetical protein M501DRAFT_999833 [Patellaria atrata CBS 101060]
MHSLPIAPLFPHILDKHLMRHSISRPHTYRKALSHTYGENGVKRIPISNHLTVDARD